MSSMKTWIDWICVILTHRLSTRTVESQTQNRLPEVRRDAIFILVRVRTEEFFLYTTNPGHKLLKSKNTRTPTGRKNQHFSQNTSPRDVFVLPGSTCCSTSVLQVSSEDVNAEPMKAGEPATACRHKRGLLGNNFALRCWKVGLRNYAEQPFKM